MPKLLIATNNQGKVSEYRDLLQGLPRQGIHFELVTPAQLGIRLEVEESGSTFAENAELKSLAFARSSRILTLADDSGLEVDALNGEPGVRSHRYAGNCATDADRVDFLLKRMKDIPQGLRSAHFSCVIAIAWPDGSVKLCWGRCDGVITFSPRGNEGFGYDPIFYFPELGKTMAELPMETKNKISHRARAAQEARKILEKMS
jgi:XTP/dITP diphosphohydrolase